MANTRPKTRFQSSLTLPGDLLAALGELSRETRVPMARIAEDGIRAEVERVKAERAQLAALRAGTVAA